MTEEEAKTVIKEYLYNHRFGYIAKDAEFDRLYEAMKVAIQALEQEPKTGHWIDKDEKSAVCSCCNKNNVLYGDFCKWCGARMVGKQERSE